MAADGADGDSGPTQKFELYIKVSSDAHLCSFVLYNILISN